MSHRKINEVLQQTTAAPTPATPTAKPLASYQQLRSNPLEGMFQPQPTPYSPFSQYEVGNPIVDFPAFQPDATGGSVADSRGPTVFPDPIFSLVNHANTSREPLMYDRNTFGQQQQQRYGMASNDLEEQEALARDFRPLLEGPRVGPKKSSQAIAEEYAKADPIYVTKTAALPQTYSHFRPLLGDGNCGWRAAGFSYFETLLRLGSGSQIDAEIARMTSLNNFLTTVGGFESWVFEDMVEETINLLKDIAASVYNRVMAADLLLQRFNDESVESAILYHLRLLASSWLKANPDNYRGFIPDELGVEGYCKEWLEVPNQEIDHLGMSLLIDVLMKPIGFAVEIVYLDLSDRSEVNSHMFQSEDPNGIPTNPTGPIIHFLYRPSHYDILYKDEDQSIPLQQTAGELVQNTNVQVNRATNFSQQHIVQNTPASMTGFSGLDMTDLLSIPGFCAPPKPHHGFPVQYSPIDQPYNGSPISASSVSPGPSLVGNSSTSGLTLPSSFPSQQTSTLTSPTLNTPHSSHSTHNPFPPTTQLPIHTVSSPQSPSARPPLASHPSDLSSPVTGSSSFRPSKYEWAAAADWQEGPVVLHTPTFKNSHYNTAHYNNPNFQPEEWNPDCEEAGGIGYGGRKKST